MKTENIYVCTVLLSIFIDNGVPFSFKLNKQVTSAPNLQTRLDVPLHDLLNDTLKSLWTKYSFLSLKDSSPDPD